MKKNLINTISMVGCIVTSLGFNTVDMKSNEVQTVKDFGIVETYVGKDVEKDGYTIELDKGEYYFELTDGSWGLYKDGEYTFQPVMLGDWSYDLDSEEDLQKITQTYISMNKYGYF